MKKIKENIIIGTMLIIYTIIVYIIFKIPSEDVQKTLYGDDFTSLESTMIYTNNGNKLYLLKDSKTGEEYAIMAVNRFNNVIDIEYIKN